MADPVLQEVHRPAALFASGIGRAEANREQRLGVLRRHANQARHPHPEERTGPTRGDRCGHANDVAGADCGGQRRHERLEVGDVAFGVGLAAHNQPEPQCARELKKLEAAQPDGQVETREQEKRDEEQGTPDEVGRLAQELFDRCHARPV